jgi:PrgI family protein
MAAATDSRRVSRHEVPTHLDVPDKAFFGLAARQFLCLLLGATLTLVVWREWTFLPAGIRLALCALCALAALVGALVRPHGRDLATWAFVLLHYAALPKTAVWRPRESVGGDRGAGPAPDAGWEDWTPRVAWAAEPAPPPPAALPADAWPPRAPARVER